MTNKSPIHWSTLTDEQKSRVFCEAIGIGPQRTGFSLGRSVLFLRREDAIRFRDANQAAGIFSAIWGKEPEAVEAYPPLTVDFLLGVAKERNTYAQIHAQRTGFYSSVAAYLFPKSSEAYAETASDAIAVAMLRFSGRIFEV
jgi:hypothetical protein